MIRNGLKIQVLKYLMAARLRDITNGWRTTAEITRDLGYRFQRGMFSALERYAKWGLIEKRKITLTEWRCTRKGQLRLLYLQRTVGGRMSFDVLRYRLRGWCRYSEA